MKIKKKEKGLRVNLESKELRPFWFFIFIAAILLVIDTIYLPIIWMWIDLVALLISAIVVFWGGFKLANTSLIEKATANRLESIITNLADGVVVYDNNFKIIVFNDTAEEIFNVKSEEVLGTNFGPERAGDHKYRLLTQVMFPSLAPTVSRLSETGKYPQVIDISFPEHELRVSTDRLLNEHNQIVGFIKLIQDRTREVQLLRSKTEFITIAAHQLRTPLTAVNWIFEGFATNKELLPEDKELAGNGLAATRKLLKIVNDLLDVSKIEEGKFGYSFEQTDLIKFLTDVLINAQAIAKEYGIKLYLDKGDETKVMANIDPSRLGLAISNLIDNAIRYNVKNGTVTIGIKRIPEKPHVELTVKDTGIGIPPQNMPKVFSKFFRAENVLKRETEGSGLGLYITKNIINRHGGTIWAESVIDRGTTFHFTLPTDPKLIPSKEVGLGG